MAVLIHYLARADDGPITSQRRVESNEGREAVISEGGRFVVACQPNRKHLALARGRGRNLKLLEWFSATGQLTTEVKDPKTGAKEQRLLITCPKCIASPLLKRDFDKIKGVQP